MLKAIINENVFIFLLGMKQASSNKSYYVEIDEEKRNHSEKNGLPFKVNYNFSCFGFE